MKDQRKNRRLELEHLMEAWLLLPFAAKTRDWYRQVFAGFIVWMRDRGYQGVLGDLDALVVRQWQRELEANGRSVNTVRGYLATLKSFSRYLAEEHIMLDRQGRPVDLLSTVKVPKLPKRRPQVYADDEIEQLLTGVETATLYGARNAAFIRLLLDAGLRVSEACGLLLDDVDWATGAVRVRWQVAKLAKERETHVGRRTLHALRRYVDGYRPVNAATDTLFVDQDRGPLTPNAVRCMLRRLGIKLGLKRVTAHGFRRTWATNFRLMGIGDLYDLQREGGWEDLEVPRRFYVEVGPAKNPASVLDRWEVAQRKRQRGRPVQEVTPIQQVEPVQGVQAVGPEKRARDRSGAAAGNGARKRVQ
jgi:site-specific recombinase XerD